MRGRSCWLQTELANIVQFLNSKHGIYCIFHCGEITNVVHWNLGRCRIVRYVTPCSHLKAMRLLLQQRCWAQQKMLWPLHTTTSVRFDDLDQSWNALFQNAACRVPIPCPTASLVATNNWLLQLHPEQIYRQSVVRFLLIDDVFHNGVSRVF